MSVELQKSRLNLVERLAHRHRYVRLGDPENVRIEREFADPKAERWVGRMCRCGYAWAGPLEGYRITYSQFELRREFPSREEYVELLKGLLGKGQETLDKERIKHHGQRVRCIYCGSVPAVVAAEGPEIGGACVPPCGPQDEFDKQKEADDE